MQRTGHPGHRQFPIFQGLPQDFQRILLKLRQFIQKQHTVMGQ